MSLRRPAQRLKSTTRARGGKDLAPLWRIKSLNQIIILNSNLVKFHKTMKII